MIPKGSEDPDKTGEFPFPITTDAEESKYLIWLRNHANYLSVSGITDYLRAIGVLVRGVLVNFLIFLPYFLAIALAVALVKVLEFWPFIVTKTLIGLFLTWVLLFSLLTPVYRIAQYKLTRATGSDSDVHSRDFYEKTFGTLLLAILAAAAFESLPGLVSVFHWQIGWPTLASSVAIGAAVFSAVPKILETLGEGLAKKLALIAVGALGIIIPLIVVLFFADYLVFGLPGDFVPVLIIAVLIFPLLVILPAAYFGWRQHAFGRAEWAFIVGLVAISVGLFYSVQKWDTVAYEWVDDESVHAAAQGLLDHDNFDALTEQVTERPGPELAKLNDWLNEDIQTDEPAQADADRWITQLVEVAEGAGLYPEFGKIVSVMYESDCAGGRPDRETGKCEKLTNELRNMQHVAETIRGLRNVGSLERRILEVLLLPKKIIEQLQKSDAYPALSEKFAEKKKCLIAEPPSAGNENNCFEIVLSVFENAGKRISNVRKELATTAAISLPGIEFYETGLAKHFRLSAFTQKFSIGVIIVIELWLFLWLTVDINLTSIHGMYRDRLASAFLIGEDTDGDVGIEKDLDLMEICNREAGSTAPYHLINVALNLQASKDIGIRDRNSDFFIFSKNFIGGDRTGYCRSESMEEVFPQLDLATAMAVSAAAASPNMGRGTTPLLVAIMTLLNVRLGFWVPNPGQVENWLDKVRGLQQKDERKGFSFNEVFSEELADIEARRRNVHGDADHAVSDVGKDRALKQDLVGIGFSGGGIRSATLNLGITQALHKHGLFDHIDYMSTVSGGGYLGASISALMRQKRPAPGEVSNLSNTGDGKISQERSHVLTSIGQHFRWRVRPGALLREILGNLHEEGRWVNVSDGGHIENLAGIELLRRRCKYIIIGDGEADPAHRFDGLATLIRTARIDLKVDIDINVDPLRLNKKGLCEHHWAIGKITYPKQEETGYLLYLKSSLTGDEDEVIHQYRSASRSFPHESTADQFFDEGQFEAYRSLGQHIAEQVLAHATYGDASPDDSLISTTVIEPASSAHSKIQARMSFRDLMQWFENLYEQVEKQA